MLQQERPDLSGQWLTPPEACVSCHPVLHELVQGPGACHLPAQSSSCPVTPEGKGLAHRLEADPPAPQQRSSLASRSRRESHQCFLRRAMELHATMLRTRSRAPTKLMGRQGSDGRAPYQHLQEDFCHYRENGEPSLCLHPVLPSLSNADFPSTWGPHSLPGETSLHSLCCPPQRVGPPRLL